MDSPARIGSSFAGWVASVQVGTQATGASSFGWQKKPSDSRRSALGVRDRCPDRRHRRPHHRLDGPRLRLATMLRGFHGASGEACHQPLALTRRRLAALGHHDMGRDHAFGPTGDERLHALSHRLSIGAEAVRAVSQLADHGAVARRELGSNRKRVERIWRRSGLKGPQRQPRRGRPLLAGGSCGRLQPERANHVCRLRSRSE